MAEFDLVDATDLVRWADRLDSRARLPELVRRLITATGKGLTGLSIRAGEGIQFPGWDGMVEAAEGDLHVPAGISVWEMGTNTKVAKKVGEDYEKRSLKPRGVDPSEATYVAVTPRRWSGKADWVADRMEEGLWKAVRVYDADDLEHWLQRARGVHAWLSARLGKDPHDAESLETWWESWSEATVPPLPAGVLLAGRAAVADRITTQLQQDPSSYTLAADSQEEAVAFVAAVLDESSLTSVLARTVIVRSVSAWRRLAVSEQRLVLIPLLENPEVARALREGHHVIVAVGREIGAAADDELPRLGRDGVETALKEAGLPDGKASRLATLGRRSLLSLRRTMAVSLAVQAPAWSKPEHAREVLPAVLAGRWTDGREADRAALAKLAGRPYETVSATMTKWANTSDPPVRRVGDVWLVSAKPDAWRLLARHLTPDDLRCFREVAIEVLGSNDPSFSMSGRERFWAPISGPTRSYSSHLIKGLADTLAMMGAVSDDVPLAGGRLSEDEATIVVRELLVAANGDSTGQGWANVSSVLRSLAEAAPKEFLRAVNAGLAGDVPLAGIFRDREETGYETFFGGSTPHTGLLWALETLAWDREYLAPVTLALARLADVDPGGRLSNRPINSLSAIHVLWSRGTTASIDERMLALDKVREEIPGVAWRLLLLLLPTGHGWTTPPNPPRWREWKPDDLLSVSYADLVRGVEAVCERILADAAADGERWAEVVGRYADFPPPFRTRIVETLQGFDPATFSAAARSSIAETARLLVARHRAYQDAEWSLPLPELDSLEDGCEHLIPEEAAFKHRELFGRGIPESFTIGGAYEQRQEALQEARTTAVAEVYAVQGLKGVFEWADQLDDAFGQWWFGYALGGAGLSTKDDEEVLGALGLEDAGRHEIAVGFVSRRFSSAGSGWVEWAQGIIVNHPDWTPAHKAAFLVALPVAPEVWDAAQAAGAEVEKAYWLHARHFAVREPEKTTARVARKLIEYGRPHDAVDLLDLYANKVPEGLPDDLVADALEAAATTEPLAPLDQMFTYHVGQHLDRLARHDFDSSKLASLEWMYLPAFRFEKRRSPILHMALSNNPEDFAQAVSMVYRAEGEEPRDLSEAEQARAMTARDLLASWQDVPGTCEDGTVDRDGLFAWVTEARRLLENVGRLRIGDHRIGQVLRYGPFDDGEKWPCDAISELIEAVASEEMEDGLSMEVYNSRGATTRGLTDGGAQERELAEQYRRFAELAAGSWPRTAALLRRIAKSYEDDARRYDLDADLRQDLWE